MPPQKLLPLVLLMVSVVACASVKSHPTTEPAAPQPSAPVAAPDSAPTTSAPPPKVEQAPPNAVARGRMLGLIEAMQELYNTGLEAHKAGRYEEARDYFDQAVNAGLDSGIPIDSNPDLKAAYEELLENIDALEGDLYTDGQPRGEEPPKEELKDITSYLTPEEAEKERQKIQPVANAVPYNIPVVLNTKVLTFVEAFQTRMRAPFEAGLRRSGRYLGMMKRIFEEEGLPTDLVYMAHQESAFKTSAYSRAKARGLWQFIAPTARKYGLKRDQWVDERSDPEKSTRAAAAYLKDLYGMFGDWHLAMAGYNAGEGKVMRGMARTGSKDFWALAQHKRALRTETKNYVPAILASIIIDKAPAEYGFHLDVMDEDIYDTVKLDSPTDMSVLADCAGTTVDVIRDLNPELRLLATPPYAEGYTLKVPAGTSRSFMEKYAAVPPSERLKWAQHQVRRGETLAAIARKYGVSVSAVMTANSMRSSKRLRPGQSLMIPLSGSMPVKVVAREQLNEDEPTYERGEKVVHRVRRGDSLHKIAERYHTSIASVKQWNRLSGTSIRPGQRLAVYYKTVAGSGSVDTSDSPAAQALNGEYRVRRGDTLFGIAQRFGVTVDQLRSVNNLSPRSVIKVGDRLRISTQEDSEVSSARPSAPNSNNAIRYRVRPGDTLEEIAARHGVRVAELMRWNNLRSANDIYAGSLLRVSMGDAPAPLTGGAGTR